MKEMKTILLLTEMVTKVCTDGGYWFQHPESNRTWTNYTRCNEHTSEGRVVGHHGMIITDIKHIRNV